MTTSQQFNDDWIKVLAWDLIVLSDGVLVLATTLRHLILAVRFSFDYLSNDRQRVEEFMKLPASKPMPNRMRREVERFLASGDLFFV